MGVLNPFILSGWEPDFKTRNTKNAMLRTLDLTHTLLQNCTEYSREDK
jgi:hypothetical protein